MSFYQKEKSSQNRFGGGFNGRNRNNRRNFRKKGSGFRNRNSNRRNREFIKESLYIKKAEPQIESASYTPSFGFNELSVNEQLKRNILQKGFKSPTPIQDQSIHHILDGKDILGIANTGTGKTGAFLIPLIEKIINNRNQKTLIITPTRELAEQINNEFFTLTKGMRLFSVECTGGNSIFRQINNIRRGYNFLIGTPGRLMDLHERGVIEFPQIGNIVLDEVDRMLDMGFIEPINQIISQLPENKQTLFFSATMNKKVEGLIGAIMRKEYIKVSVKTADTAKNIDQDVIKFKSVEEKIVLLEQILNKESVSKTLIFVNTKRYADKLDNMLYQKGFRVTAIHGDKRQRERSRSIDKFKKGEANILVATDVAARGLDISNVSHVINYDEPNSYDDYVHRIGRTGRANKTGVALTFVPHR